MSRRIARAKQPSSRGCTKVRPGPPPLVCVRSASSRPVAKVVGPPAPVPASTHGGAPKSDGKITLRHRALQEQETLPRTVSVGGSKDGRVAHSSPTARHDFDLCTLTGLLSNVMDDYAIFPKVLGEGHYGCVRECVSHATRRTYACNLIHKSRVARLDHLQNEILLLAEMDHLGVMRMVDCSEDVDYVHIISEKYTGGELFEKIVDRTTKRGCLSEPEAACMVKQLLEAVAYLHENDITHRDIKPENILFETEDEKSIKLIDFGLSRRHGEGKAPMTNPVGTAYYMAPELLRGRYGKSCDVWSVGTIVYILLCGYPPFNGDTDPEIFESIRRGRFGFPEAQWAGVSAEAKDFIWCLLQRDPRKRFTAGEALCHPWSKNLGRKPSRKVQRKQVQPKFSYLRIP